METARQSETAPKGWPAALLMFHLSMWRERLRNALVEVRDGRSYTPPPENVDEFNEAELAHGIGTPLADAASRSEHLLSEILDLYQQIGDKPFQWYLAKTTTEAVLRNSYTHPRTHLYAYLLENGDAEVAYRLFEDAATEMRSVSAPPIVLGAVLYNLASTRAAQGRLEEAVELISEALPMRPDMKKAAAEDSDLAPLRDHPRFQELIKP